MSLNILRFEWAGAERKLLTYAHPIAIDCAKDIIEGRSYPWPQNDSPERVVDLGACVGEWTIMAAALWPNATIYAFEPFPESFRLLEQNCKPFPNIKLFQAAVSEEEDGGKTRLLIDEFGPLCHSLSNRGRVIDELEVEAVRPQHIAGLNPDIIKCDIEGAESWFLSGFNRFLPLETVHRIFVEFHSKQIRLFIEDMLRPTHDLTYARIPHADQGEVAYLRRDS